MSRAPENEERQAWQIEWGKLALILVLMLGGFGLVFVALLSHALSDDRFAITLALGSSIITGCMGYLFGNGRLASKGQLSVPTISPAPAPVYYPNPIEPRSITPPPRPDTPPQ